VTLMKASDATVKLQRSTSSGNLLGEWCIRKGLATEEEIASSLRAQQLAEAGGGAALRLGEILVARGILTHHQVAEALAAQQKEIRFCPRCGIQINVSKRGDAAQYRCGRCQGPLETPEGTAPLHAVDEDFILVSRDPLPPDVQSALEDPATRFGKYVLLKQIGQGGIGVVYLAWDTYLSQYVALKRLRTARPLSPQDTPNEHIQSLLKEARHSIRLRHPGVVSVFDVGRIGREYYVVMEYLEGETLAERLQAARKNGVPSPYYENPQETLRQLVEIALAVEYAHSRPSPIVHCDLKPANILIDREQHPHVLDFGLARNLKLDKPEQGEISGTPSYMAPEQASGESSKIDCRTDVYAFGAILYEMLTGRPPFVGGTIEVIGKTIGEEPARPSTSLRGTQKDAPKDPSTKALLRVPPGLEELCMKCLKKDRDLRPRTMAEVARELEVNFHPSAPPATLAPLSTPVSPKRSLRSWKSIAPIALAATMLLGGSALVISLLRSGTADRASFESRESEIHRAIASFHPASARALAIRLRDEARGDVYEGRASRLAEEATWVIRLQNRIADRLASSPLDWPALRTRSGEAAGRVRIVGSDSRGFRVIQDGRTSGVSWESLDPVPLLELLQAALGVPEDSDVLALGILSLRCGLRGEEGRYFARLRTTPLGPVAERYESSQNE